MESSDIASSSVGSIARDDPGYAALRTGAGVRNLDGRIVVRVVGDDRVSFLNGMSSANIGQASAGDVLPGLFLTEHAHLIADFVAWITADAILLELDEALWTRARAHLDKLLVADDVEFESTDFKVVSTLGPRAQDAVRAIAEPPSERRFTVSGALMLGNAPRLGLQGYSVLIPQPQAQNLLSRIQSAGAREVDATASEIVRIENGIARVGVDTFDKTIALEAGLRDSISFDKGCYVGQETIERATARGGLHKKLLGLTFDAGTPAAIARLMLADKEVGRATSVAWSPRFGTIGLAILHQSAWAEGTELAVEGGGKARVSGLPFRP